MIRDSDDSEVTFLEVRNFLYNGILGACKHQGFLGGSVVKGLPANAGETGLIPGLGRSPGEENGGYPLHYSVLENSRDCTVHGVTKSWTQWSDFHD